MNNRWTAQEARARIGQVMKAARLLGPQIITRDGVEIAAMISIEDWRSRLEAVGRSEGRPAMPQLAERTKRPQKRQSHRKIT